MPEQPEILASFWTLAGDRLPHDAPNVARFPLAERIAAAARAGFTGMGFSFDDAAAFRREHDDVTLRAMFRDAAIRWIELEALLDWFAHGERRAASDARRRAALDQARALGAYQIKVVGEIGGGGPLARADGEGASLDRMAADFAGLCREAAVDGIRITIELLPISNLPSIASGRRIVEQAGEPNGGLMFDAWHVKRGGIALADIAALPSGLCRGIELDDLMDEPEMPDLYDEMIHCRRLPGEGEFDNPGLVAAARAAGFAGPYGVEVLSGAHRALPLREAAARSFAAAHAAVLAGLERAA